MFLAWKEIRRARVRFGLLMAAIGLLVFLILFQQTLQNGLLNAFVGAIRNQSAPVLVYSVDGQRTLQGSIITPDLEATIRGADGVESAGRIGQGTFSVTVDGTLESAAIIGYEDPDLGAPTTLSEGRLPDAPGEAVSGADLGAGYAVGDTIRVEPGGYEIEVVGRATDISLQASPTLFTTYDTYVAAAQARNPDVTAVLPNVIAVSPTAGVTDQELASTLNDTSDDIDALPRAQAADDTPGVAQVQQSFLLIFALYALVIPMVTGLFFLIITFQKANSLTLLRAIGAPARRLVAALLIQVVIVMGCGLLLGVLLYTPISQLTIGSIPLQFERGAVLFWTVLLLILGIVSSLVSAYRVLQIDPIRATTGVGVGT